MGGDADHREDGARDVAEHLEDRSMIARLPMVSTGTDIRRPRLLSSAPMAQVLEDIAGGRWCEQVGTVRALAYRSREQTQRKKLLPYWTPAGLFRYRSASGMMEHSGHVSIDLDDLGAAGA